MFLNSEPFALVLCVESNCAIIEKDRKLEKVTIRRQNKLQLSLTAYLQHQAPVPGFIGLVFGKDCTSLFDSNWYLYHHLLKLFIVS